MADNAKTENKASNAAPDNKNGNAVENNDSVKSEGSGDIELEQSDENDAELPSDDAAATDQSDAKLMTFLKEGSYDLVGGASIYGREGDQCALAPADAEQAIASGLMEIAKT
ncbi:MAG: hypothetical protein U5K75_11065 [Ahrensia sp.]|nr:hypothetical protein [Ahrensia sp.]